MKIAVSGYRKFSDFAYLCRILPQFQIDSMVFGDCDGTDALAERYCIENKIPYDKKKADWKKYGRSAGPIRNRKILDEMPGKVLLFLHPLSKGTKDMLNAVKERNISYEIHYIDF